MDAGLDAFGTFSLEQTILDAGGVKHNGKAGQDAFRWRGQPKAFIFLTSGSIAVHFRTKQRQIPWATCRAIEGQDCMPVTASILSGGKISVRATCSKPSTWIELPPTTLVLLVHGNTAFRRALFANHAKRLPGFFSRLSSRHEVALDRRLAGWLLSHAGGGKVAVTHEEIAADLLTAREVVTRRLREFAVKGWIHQERGLIRLDACAALARVSKGYSSVSGHRVDLLRNNGVTVSSTGG